MRSRYIQNGIMNIMSDRKFHTLQEIADRLEVHRITVYRHIQDLSVYYTFTSKGGRDGGFRLLGNQWQDNTEEKLTKEEVSVVIMALKAIGYFDAATIIRKLKGD